MRKAYFVGGFIAAALAFIGFLTVPMLTLAAPSTDNHELPANAKSQFKIVSFKLPSDIALGEKLQGEAIIRNAGTLGGTALIEVRINGRLSSLYDIKLQPGEESRYPIRLVFEKMGVYHIEVKTPHDSRNQDVTVGPAADDEETPPPSTTPPPSGQPPAPGGSPLSLAILDTDRDCKLSDSEFFAGIDRWVTSGITDILFFSAVDAWIGQSSICAASSRVSGGPFQTRHAGAAIVFAANAPAVTALTVQIFDVNGRPVFAQTAPGNQLRWALNKLDGEPVANGVYLYALSAKTADGKIERSMVKKLLLLR